MAYGWISITGVRFSTNLGGRIDLYPCHFLLGFFFLVFLGWKGAGLQDCNDKSILLSGFPRLSVLRVADARLGVLFSRIPKSFRQVTRGGFMMGGRRLSTKTLHMSQEGAIYDIAIPHGERQKRAKTTAFWGKQKNFNIFSFPELLDVDIVFLAWLGGKRRRTRGGA